MSFGKWLTTAASSVFGDGGSSSSSDMWATGIDAVIGGGAKTMAGGGSKKTSGGGSGSSMKSPMELAMMANQEARRIQQSTPSASFKQPAKAIAGHQLPGMVGAIRYTGPQTILQYAAAMAAKGAKAPGATSTDYRKSKLS